MLRNPALFAACVVFGAPLALADDESPKGFADYERKHQFMCNAPLEKLPAPDVKEHLGFRFEHRGWTVKAERQEKSAPGEVRLGVVAGIKDMEPETQAALVDFLKEFEKAGVEAVLVGGDSSDQPGVLEELYVFLGERVKVPILTVAGNSERGAAHNYAILKAREKGAHHLINMSVVRRYDGTGFDVVSLSGYHDSRFFHMAGGCQYSKQDVKAVGEAARGCDRSVIVLAHGPPQQKGKDALDFVPGHGNVGDPVLTEVIKQAKIPFGVFGHIIEAGGTGTDLSGKRLAPGKFHKALYLNQGSANPLPWKLNNGVTSHGLAAILTLKDGKAKYEVLRGVKRIQ